MSESLDGFPQKTIDFCTQRSFVIKDGYATQHPIAKDSVDRTPGSLFIRNKTTEESTTLRIIQENDHRTKKRGGRVFNENLQKVCDFKFLNGSDDAAIDCVGVGKIAARVEIISVIGGKFRVFGENESVIILVSNLSIEELNSKFPNLLKNRLKNKNCSFNCK